MYLIYLSFSFLTMIFLSLLFILGVKKNISKELKFCITELTELQHSHRKLTKALFLKNNTAFTLRASRKALEITYKLAPAYAKAAALAALNSVKVLQKTLVTYQKNILYQATLDSYKRSRKLFKNGYLSTSPPQGLLVKAYPKNSDSPSYRLQKDYQNKKKTIFYKRINITKILPTLLKKNLNFNTNFNFKCGSTLTIQGGLPSNIKLILDN